MASQHYSLKWNDYSTKIVAAFQSLRDEKDFVDVTVACDNRQFPAHKMVLSACSPYFRSILKVNPCKHPIIILKDVTHFEMEKLLEFMYNGEVNIAQENLPAFLRIAENLKVKGLAGSASEMEQLYNNKDIPHQLGENPFTTTPSKNNSLVNNKNNSEPIEPSAKKKKLDFNHSDKSTNHYQEQNKSTVKNAVVMKDEPYDDFGSEPQDSCHGQEEILPEAAFDECGGDSSHSGISGEPSTHLNSPEHFADGCEALNLSVRPHLNNHCSQPPSPQQPVQLRYKTQRRNEKYFHQQIELSDMSSKSVLWRNYFADSSPAVQHEEEECYDSNTERLYARRASSAYPSLLSSMAPPPPLSLSQPASLEASRETSPTDVVYKVKLECPPTPLVNGDQGGLLVDHQQENTQHYLLHCVDKMGTTTDHKLGEKSGSETNVLSNTISTILSAEMTGDSELNNLKTPVKKRDIMMNGSAHEVIPSNAVSPVDSYSPSKANSRSPNGSATGGTGKLYPCSKCHKVFRHPMSLHHHRHVHIGTYTCQCCNKVFSRRWDLHRHLHRSKLGCRRPKDVHSTIVDKSSAAYSPTKSDAFLATIKTEPYYHHQKEYHIEDAETDMRDSSPLPSTSRTSYGVFSSSSNGPHRSSPLSTGPSN